MRRFSCILASIALSTIAFAGVANAQEPAPLLTVQAPTQNEKAETKPESDHKTFSVGVNPLGLAIGRYSLQAEYMPAAHHAITLNPYFVHAPVKVTVNGTDVDGGSLGGFGGEVGYRYYTSGKGMAGFFVGPSILFGSYSQSAPSGSTASSTSDSFGSYGGAIDIGGQAIVGPGIVLGGGFGLQYTKTTKDINTDNLNLASAVLAGGGVRPRFLFTVAYAF